MPSEQANITPAVLRWAREAAGYSVKDVSAKLGVKPDRVELWESGDAPVTIGRLDALAAIYKRPTAVFYLPSPPLETIPRPTDFRSKKAQTAPTPAFIYQVRHAVERRGIALDLMEELGEAPASFEFKCRLDEPPPEAGDRLRRMLGVSLQEQQTWKDYYKALGSWKDAAERCGVLVFQGPRKDLKGARGFSLHEDVLPMVVLSTEDTPAGRIFTLFHELAHLGLREGGICDLHDEGTELFCNRVAAAALMPAKPLLGDARKAYPAGKRDWPEHVLTKLAKLYGVSEEALLLRLVGLSEATWEFYCSKRALFAHRAKQAAANKGEGWPPQHVTAIARNGHGYTRLVLEAYQRRLITEHRASSYLHVSFDGLLKITQEVMWQAWGRAQ